MNAVKIIECPRDAMQGVEKIISTPRKVDYINKLLTVGFDTLDFGSFVSPQAVPQMRDTAEVLSQLKWGEADTKLLAIVANRRGAQEACEFESIRYLGFPLSLSETFQRLNTNSSIAEALDTLSAIQERCIATGKILVCYLSMGFGNPYNDPYDYEVVARFVARLVSLEVQIVSLADTVGVSDAEQIRYLFTHLLNEFPALELGAHLHSDPASAGEKIKAAYKAGCKRFDSALRGWGGCPLSKNKLVGNIATETLLRYLGVEGVQLFLDGKALDQALYMADAVFGKHDHL